VYRRVRVGVISTGDELVEGPQALAPGQIRDSNRPMLLALVTEAGAEAVDLGTGRDDEAAVERMFLDAAASCDAVITSGGVSVGDYDVVKAVLDRLGALEWWQVAIKPAKPLAFGLLDGTPVFGLPGNPVSSHVSFELFARPALRRMMGHPRPERPVVRASAGAAMPRRADGKLYLDRVRVEIVDGGYVAVRSGEQASNVLSGLADANGLALLADGPGPRAGDPVDVMLLT
jgi:molybdenum cofactor synthesis domain-containing protein